MKYLYTGKEAKAIDRHATQTVGIPGLVLMEKAAMTVAAVLMQRENKNATILAVCGTGNNGGDGIAAARILHEQGYHAAITVAGSEEKMTEETKKQIAIAAAYGVPVLPLSALSENRFDVLIDGLFGIGLSRAVEGVYEKIIQEMNESGAVIYSLDMPSGIHAGTGAVLHTAVRAACTITFGVNKAGLLLYPGCEYAGEVMVCDIGFPQNSIGAVKASYFYYEPEELNKMPYRPPHSHKGTFGNVLVVAGSHEMSGAAYLAAKAAYRMGAGLVRVISTENNRNVLLSALPEILFSTRESIQEGVAWADAIVIGPGLSLDKEAQELVRYVIDKAEVPTVIDGDGIRLCRDITGHLREHFILTPHVKEMSVLTGIGVSELLENIPETTKKAAKQWQCIIAQKDARTAVSDGQRCYLNVSGNNGMATGGSGDVLAGMIGGLLAQKAAPFEAASLGVYLHGLAGDAMARQKGVYSLMASDVIEGISLILNAQREK